MRSVLLVVLLLALAVPALAGGGPDLGWLERQKGVSVVSRHTDRTVYKIKGDGDKLLAEYRARLLSQGWTLINSVYSGPMRHLRVSRDTLLADVTLQQAKPSSKLTVSTSPSKSHGVAADKILNGDELTGTYVSQGGAFVVNGSSCEVTVKGPCSIVRINGSHNEVHIDGTAAAILVRGNDNQVKWSRKKNVTPPVITNAGTYNVIGGY